MALSQFPVTVRGAELLKEELQRLRGVDRPNIIQAIAEARAQGDYLKMPSTNQQKSVKVLLKAALLS